ncbi:MAG TPA: hypothetical protein VI793_08400 [Anaerolineales bacterium]|nr:hypothetical protein [Anaerolineales bacterium]
MTDVDSLWDYCASRAHTKRRVDCMTWIDWLIVALAVLEAGWMAFDGTRAPVVGDYVTPKEGRTPGSSARSRGWSPPSALRPARR